MTIWDKKIIDPQPDAFGLDISDLSLKAIQFCEKRGFTDIKGVGSIALPRESIVDGLVMKPDVVIEAINRLRSERGITARDVYCSVPETKAFLRIISVPKMSAVEASEAIKWELEANIPMALDQVYYDWQIIKPSLRKSRDKMDVLVVAVAKTIVDQLVDVVEKAGLRALGFEVESVAQARSLISAQQKEASLIVDIGDRRTSFMAMVGSVPVFTSSVPLSAEMMTDIIAKDLALSHAEAESIKVEHGIGSALKNDHIFSAMKPFLESVTMEVKKSLNFYERGLQYTQAIESVVLCGGGARTRGMVPYLSRRLGREIAVGNPWVNINFESLPPIDRQSAVRYTTAIGLAMRSFDEI